MMIANIDIYYRIPIKIGLFLSFPLIMYLSGFYNKEEMQQMRHAIGELKNKYTRKK
jgi:hypothetical protein